MTRGRDTVRWTVRVSSDTNRAVRRHLVQTNLKTGGLSKFVGDAVRWRLFDLNLKAAQTHNVAAATDEIEREIEEALTEVRARRFVSV